ncbi:hypothetical protein LTR50_005512 [Elasticomyces elasticus]|nr:hypothetical protein LTR50_005512 [Elasticomyces elasticus]
MLSGIAGKEELAEVTETASAKLLVVLVAKLAAVATRVELLDTALLGVLDAALLTVLDASLLWLLDTVLLRVLRVALLVVLTPASIEVLDTVPLETVDSVDLEATSLLDATSLEEVNAGPVELLGFADVEVDETPTAFATRGDVAEALGLPEGFWLVEEVLVAVAAGVAENELLMLSEVVEVETTKDVLLSTSELEFIELELLDVGTGGMLGVALLEVDPVAVVLFELTLDEVDETLCPKLFLEVLAIVTVDDTNDKLLLLSDDETAEKVETVVLDSDNTEAVELTPTDGDRDDVLNVTLSLDTLVYIDEEDSLVKAVANVDENESLEEGLLLDEAVLSIDDDNVGTSDVLRAGSLLGDAAPVAEEERASDTTVLLGSPLLDIGEGVPEMELSVDDALLDVDEVDATKAVVSDAVDEDTPVVGLLSDTIPLEVDEDSTFKFALLPADAAVNVDEDDKSKVDIDDADTTEVDPLLVVLLKVLEAKSLPGEMLLCVDDDNASRVELL